MIDWVLGNHASFVRFSRWIVGACGAALVGLANLPHNAVDRVIGIVGIAAVAIIFTVWLGLVLVTILKPRLINDARRKRAETAAMRSPRDITHV